MHMNKIRTTITINKDLLKKAQQHDISISSFLDIELRRYIAYVEGNVFGSAFSEKGECGRRDLNPSYKLGKLM